MVSFVDTLRTHRVLGIVRGSSAEAAEAAALALLEEGIGLIEVSLTTPDAVRVIGRLVAAAPADCLVGAGTVVTDAEAEAVAEVGAGFAVSPGLTSGIRRAVALGLPVAPGVYTPSEVYAALELGAEAVKLFPASVGGPDYLKALRQPMPDVAFVPVGGVGLDEARAYLAAGAVAVGVGSPLVGDAASGGDLSALRRRAEEFARVARDFA
ncbi:MAG TPA: bifunctional 4-hydroxy-2-oxoglutarate aldolase/2-dehydro-3-deoxy-phosphogluconate aldolase [Propionibacteriaceae bacterium]|nr:bifunctional 4-hydroxy-2-oxoglutarate aldolase/2-dehydro-3-deoxy-phosphogluconate aldolase [Propionibacteriaceae bacterium]